MVNIFNEALFQNSDSEVLSSYFIGLLHSFLAQNASEARFSANTSFTSVYVEA
jgi:hypothetical protein